MMVSCSFINQGFLGHKSIQPSRQRWLHTKKVASQASPCFMAAGLQQVSKPAAPLPYIATQHPAEKQHVNKATLVGAEQQVGCRNLDDQEAQMVSGVRRHKQAMWCGTPLLNALQTKQYQIAGPEHRNASGCKELRAELQPKGS
eukprot:scaffold93902_cov17-Tisochrysis_lutea.AAC.1